MPNSFRTLISGFRVASLGALAGRVIGLARDVATAYVLGASASPAMDALAVAWRLPDLARRLFVEGALSASYLPEIAKTLDHDRREAQRLAGGSFLMLAMTMAAVVVLGEIAIAILGQLVGSEDLQLLLRLEALLLPFVLTACLTAHLAATLNAVKHFAIPALAPAMLNVVWLVAIVFVAPQLSDEPGAQATVLAAAVLIGGCVQVAAQWMALAKERFLPLIHWPRQREKIFRIASAALPAIVGLSATQVNAFVDSYSAWLLSGGGDLPLRQGAAAALHYAERLCMFPLGLVGLAVATVIYPLLAEHAARGDVKRVAEDLTLGLRIILVLAIPAGVGLMLLAEPITRLLFEYGQFNAQDTARTAQLMAAYGAGVWAICAAPVIVRAHYALDDRRTPVAVAAGVMLLNLAGNLALVWSLAEVGLVAATVASAGVQAVVLLVLFSRRYGLPWWGLMVCLLRCGVAVLAMVAIAKLAAPLVAPGDSLATRAAAVFVPLTLCAVGYLVVYFLIGGREIAMLLARNKD